MGFIDSPEPDVCSLQTLFPIMPGVAAQRGHEQCLDLLVHQIEEVAYSLFC